MEMNERERWLLFTLAACVTIAGSACDSGTGGQIVRVDLVLTGEGATPGAPAHTFVTDTGWSVTLTEAKIALGPVYVFVPRRRSAQLLREVLLPGRAHAHGGHEAFAPESVAAEMLDQVAFDVLDPGGAGLGTIDATAGAITDLSVYLEPPDAANSAAMHGHHLYVRGSAVKESAAITFEGGLDIPDQGIQRRVDGIPIEATLSEGGTLHLAVRPSSWFTGAEFDALPERGAGEARVITATSQVHTAWFLGARSARAFRASFDAAPL